MKRIENILIIFVFLLFFSCDKETFKDETFKDSINITEFYTYTNCGNAPCTGTLNHDGETVVITGYISAINNFPTENRLHVYETSIDVGLRLEIHIIKDGNKIFDEISNHLSKLSNPDNEYVKVSIRGKIIGIPLFTDNGCFMGAFIEIDDDNDIRFE